MDKSKVVEMLQCALINCDNVRALGLTGVQIVKMQIQEALDLLSQDEATEGQEENDAEL